MFNEERFINIKTKLRYNSNQSKLAMSNKYFRIFNQLVRDKKLKKANVPYAFSYMYLMSYLFRYTKYDNVILNSMEVKELLGYSPTNKTIDYITKKDGLLDSEGLSSTLYDFPVVHELVNGEIEFTMLSEFNDGTNAYGTKWRQIHNVNFNASCKYPVLGFYENIELYKQEGVKLDNLGGTYYNPSDTTLIPFEVYMYCMSHAGLGCTGFYIYCYITHQVDLYGNCQMSITELSRSCNMGETAIIRYMNILRKYNLIHTIVAEKFIIGMNKNVKERAEANTHFNNHFNDFVKNENVLELVKPNYVHIGALLKQEKQSQTLDAIDFFGS